VISINDLVAFAIDVRFTIGCKLATRLGI